MKLCIRHFTQYSYGHDVFLEPHYLRFRPRSVSYLKLIDFTLDVLPMPEGSSSQADPENNRVEFCWFSGMHSTMEVRAESVVELTPFNPFEFLLYPAQFTRFPYRYPTDMMPVLQNALAHLRLEKDLLLFQEKLAKESDYQTIPFLQALTQAIHNRTTLELREKGTPYTPEKTFRNQGGSCRDLAWMQLQLLRMSGFATRFMSGYLYLETEDPEFELHAWLEVYLPGAGWIGLDPSHGIFTDHHYMPVAASVQHENTMPVTGTVRGDAKALLKTELDIRELP